MRRLKLLVTMLVAATVIPTTAGAADRTLYDARVLGAVPDGDRSYIEGITYDGTDVYAGTASGSTGSVVPISTFGVPSKIFSWNRLTGEANAPIVVAGEDLTHEHATTGMMVDDDGSLLVLSLQHGLLRFTRQGSGWQQDLVAAIPNIPPCSMGAAPCSPTLTDRGSIGNDLTSDSDGNIYISDSWQATIWKLTPAGVISAWYQSADLDRLFGANGLRITPDGASMAIAVTGPDTVAVPGVVDRASRVIAVPFPNPYAGPARDLLVLPNGATTDGIAYGEHGDLFVLANSTNQIYIARSDGTVDVVENADLTGGARMDFPASLVFDGAGALLIVNYAWFDGITPIGSKTVIDVWVDDLGA